MDIVVATNIVVPACVILAGWGYAFHHLRKSKFFTGGMRTVWFVVIFLVPVGGTVAYFTAHHCIKRYSSPNESRLKKYLPMNRPAGS